MTFDPSKPVQTRDGRKARVLCADLKGDYPIGAVVTNPDGKEWLSKWHVCGHLCEDPQNELDLINTPEEHEVVVFLHKHPTGPMWVNHDHDPDTAIASRRITFKEGEFAD